MTIQKLAAYLSFFDVAASRMKYVQALRKASSVASSTWVPEQEVKELLRGSAKFSIPSRKSYISGQQTGKIVNHLVRKGHVALARLVAVCYTFQLRAQAEAFPLQYGVKGSQVSGSTDSWHSDVLCESDRVVIKFHSRKD